jgi:hypothetical protein
LICATLVQPRLAAYSRMAWVCSGSVCWSCVETRMIVLLKPYLRPASVLGCHPKTHKNISTVWDSQKKHCSTKILLSAGFQQNDHLASLALGEGQHLVRFHIAIDFLKTGRPVKLDICGRGGPEAEM